jgi:hypothetical protein
MSSALQAAKRIRAEAKESGAEKLRPGNKEGLPLSGKPEFMVLITTVFFVCKAFSACSVKGLCRPGAFQARWGQLFFAVSLWVL